MNVRRLPRFNNRLMSITLNVDVTPFLRALQRAAENMAKSMDTMAQHVRRMGQAFTRQHEVRISGLEAKMYVRAGLDPQYATEDALHGLVRLLMRKPSAVLGLQEGTMLGRSDRARLAAAAMRGWAEHRPEPWRHPEVSYPSPLPWYRYMAGQAIHVEVDGTVSIQEVAA